MASTIHNLSNYNPNDIPGAKDFKFGLVVSAYNQHITFALRDACIETLQKHEVTDENIFIQYVPGAYELPVAAKYIADNHPNLNAIIILGCVIKGETDHDKYINQAVANGLMQLNLQYAIPFIFGLLTPNNEQQAKDRAGGKHGNKGVEAAVAAIHMASMFKQTAK